MHVQAAGENGALVRGEGVVLGTKEQCVNPMRFLLFLISPNVGL